MECVPFETAAVKLYPTRDSWLADAPATVATMLGRWNLVAGRAFVGGIAGSVLEVTRADGQPAVLKVAYPHVEGTWEAVGLQLFPSACAPAVLRQDPWTWSLLLAAVRPGTPLNSGALAPREALEAGGRLHVAITATVLPPEVALPQLTDAMIDYAGQARARLGHQAGALRTLGVRSLVVAAVDELEALAGSGPTRTLLHGDYNPGNILDDGRGAWVAIDPKPLLGDPAYDLWPLISQIGDPMHAVVPAARLAEQLTIAADAAACDATRAGRWSWARTGLNVSWYLAAGDRAQAARAAAELRAWTTVVGY